MALGLKHEPSYCYDGSSTDSEPYDDGEALASTRPAPPAAATVASVKREGTPAPPTASTGVAPRNVLDLSPLPLEAHMQSSTPVDLPKHAVKKEPLASASAISVETSEASAACSTCHKATLGEAARLTPALEGQETLFCNCCALTLPSFCFTTLQRQASRPECRGCRGVPTVVASLTLRVKKLLGQQAAASAAGVNSSRAVVPTASRVVGGSPQEATGTPESRAGVAGGTTADTAPATDGEDTCGKCGKAKLREAARLTAQLVGQEALYCRCCALTLASFCFTAPQRAAREPTCRGCRGSQSVVELLTARADKLLRAQQQQAAGAPATADASGQAAAPAAPAAPASRKQAPCHVCLLPLKRVTLAQAREQGKLQCSCCARELPTDLYSNGQLHKAERRRCRGCTGNVGKPSAEKVAAGFKAWKAQLPKTKKEKKKKKKKQQTHQEKRQGGKQSVSRNRIVRFRLAMAALSRKRAENDLRGSTRIEYMKELAKEEAALKRQGAILRLANPAAYREIMSAKVKRPRHGRDESDESSDDSDDDVDADVDADELVLNGDAPAPKRRRTDGDSPSVGDGVPLVVDLTTTNSLAS